VELCEELEKLTATSPFGSEEITLAHWAREIRLSALQEMLSAASRPDILSFALGLPAKELFPIQAFAQAMAQALASDARALQYSPPLESLKAHVVALMAERGVSCQPEQIFLTAGAQQGMNLLTRLLLDTGGKVLIEDLAYPGFRQVIEPYQPEILTVSLDLDTGMEVDEVESILARGARPAFIYTVTDGHNPTSVSLSMEKRLRLVQLARRYGVPIIEDDAYGFLSYGTASLPPMRALDAEIVFYVGSFSKILAPALRAGWIVATERLMPRLSIVKEASDIDTATFAQRCIAAYLDGGHLPAHLAELRREYAMRRDAMLAALQSHFPAGCRWRKPTNGVFIWVELPGTVNAYELLKIAIEDEKVAFIPGQAFQVSANGRESNAVRLNFSNCTLPQIEEGIFRLARALKRFPA
jgi:2-aminoadipate transaminase